MQLGLRLFTFRLHKQSAQVLYTIWVIRILQYKCVCVYIHIYVCIYICVYIYVCVCVCVCVRM